MAQDVEAANVFGNGSQRVRFVFDVPPGTSVMVNVVDGSTGRITPEPADDRVRLSVDDKGDVRTVRASFTRNIFAAEADDGTIIFSGIHDVHFDVELPAETLIEAHVGRHDQEPKASGQFVSHGFQHVSIEVEAGAHASIEDGSGTVKVVDDLGDKNALATLQGPSEDLTVWSSPVNGRTRITGDCARADIPDPTRFDTSQLDAGTTRTISLDAVAEEAGVASTSPPGLRQVTGVEQGREKHGISPIESPRAPEPPVLGWDFTVFDQ